MSVSTSDVGTIPPRSTTGSPGGSIDAWLSAASAARGPADLPPVGIGGLLRALAAHPGLTARISALRPETGGRAWECLWRDDHLDVWLIGWDGGADTGWHDHDTSSGAFLVLEGAVVEERPRWTGVHESRTVPVGGDMMFGPDHVHRINTLDGSALTLHAYSPPLRRLGQYRMDDDGVVRRRTIGWEEELRAEAP